MSRLPLIPLLMATAAALPAPALAQIYSTVPQPQSDADALAAAVRTLGANPKNIDALVTAGELSMRLGDASAAAAFFARAEKVDARNGRVKAGEAALLVHEERPGEALRYFDQAVGFGIDPARFAAERGLAYDLIGEPDRAQRDYRLALRSGGENPEVTRRYALSLGISGKRDLALQLLDPLLRQNDRSAWRARAFILAMAGDVTGASHIATTMMPPGMATGLQPFFERLPSLPAADRAFAVHFGEVRATPERLADARMVPALPVLGPDPTAPVMVASQPTPPVQVAARDDTRKTKRDTRRSTKQMAAAKPKPPAYALQMVQSLPGKTAPAPAPPIAVPIPAPAVIQPAAAATASVALPTTVTAAASPRVTAPPQVAAAATAPNLPQVSQFTTTFAQNQARWEAAKRAEERRAAAASVRAAATPAPVAGKTSAVALANADAASQLQARAAAPEPAAIAQPAPRVATVTPGPAIVRQPLAEPPVSRPATPVAAAAPPAAAPPAGAGDSILAKIIANITVPDSELAAAPVPVRSAGDIAAERAAATRAAAAKREAAAQALADRKAAAAKKLADAKAAADRKAAADKKAAEEKLAKADPPRVWVQVAGGANESDLAKAWKGVQGKSAALKGKSAYSTPLRATNRLVTGPFKSDDEAQAFVNTLAKQGVSAFTFTSTKGQKMTPVGGK